MVVFLWLRQSRTRRERDGQADDGSNEGILHQLVGSFLGAAPHSFGNVFKGLQQEIQHVDRYYLHGFVSCLDRPFRLGRQELRHARFWLDLLIYEWIHFDGRKINFPRAVQPLVEIPWETFSLACLRILAYCGNLTNSARFLDCPRRGRVTSCEHSGSLVFLLGRWNIVRTRRPIHYIFLS